MNPAVVGVFVPIVLFLVTGLVLVTYYYFRSREKQMLIDKGLDAESIKQFYENKKDPYRLLKIGIICIAFGVGLGIGLYFQEVTEKDFWVPFALFTFTGIGFVIANLVARGLENKTRKNEF
jgi:predicted acyltransferase